MAADILAVLETEGGRVRESAYELIGLARQLAAGRGGRVVAAVLGAEPTGAAQDAARRGADHVWAIADASLAQVTADGWSLALKALLAAHPAEIVLLAHTPVGWDVGPRLAAMHGLPALTEVSGVADNGAAWTRPVFNGKLQVTLRLTGSPAVVTVQRGAFAPHEGASTGTVEPFAPGLDPGAVRQRFVEVRSAPKGKVDLAAADIIVSGGRAMGGPEKFAIIRELAEALGGEVGASRPVTDAGWLPHEHQVGSSGVTVKPKLYVAAGISGAIQHIVGMKQSGFIVAINRDREAPIFEVADVGVVGDLFEIVPALTRAVREARGRG